MHCTILELPVRITYTFVSFTRRHYQNKKLCYCTENSASVMLSWFIHCLKALSDERDKMLSNKCLAVYETSQFLVQILTTELNCITTLSQR